MPRDAETRKKRLAVVLFNLGGPDQPSAIKPFLVNLFTDPAILRVPFFVRPFLARIIARNMVDDLLRDMFARLEAGRSVSPSWLRGRLALARYQRVTFVDLFQAWAWAAQAALAAR